MEISGSLRVPLPADVEEPPALTVQTGQRISAGELLLPARDDSPATHAPAAGVVSGLHRVNTTEHADVLALEMTADPRQHPQVPRESTTASVLQFPPAPDTWDSAIAAAGVVGGSGGIGVPRERRALSHLIQAAKQRGVREVLFNGMETEPYLTGAYRILIDHTDDVLSGVHHLALMLGAARAWVAVGASDKRLLRYLKRRIKGLSQNHCGAGVSPAHVEALRPGGKSRGVLRIRFAGAPGKYPACSPRLLVRCVLGRTAPAAGDCLDAGALVLDARTALAAEWAIRHQCPLTSAVLTVSGERVGRPGNYRVAVGTSVSDILRQADTDLDGEVNVIVGGPLTGRSLVDRETVVTKSTTALLVLPRTRSDFGPTACVRCGWCLDDCPVGLDPVALLNAVESGDDAGACRLHVEACIACGVCSYVCPSRLPLSSSIVSMRDRARRTRK